MVKERKRQKKNKDREREMENRTSNSKTIIQWLTPYILELEGISLCACCKHNIMTRRQEVVFLWSTHRHVLDSDGQAPRR